MNAASGLDLTPIDNKDTLTQRVYGEVRRALLSGTFRPGQRITVREVALAMGVSITPVRDALGRIAADGGLEQAGPKTIMIPILSQERFQELEDVRIALESIIAGAVTANADKAFIQKLESINRDFSALRRDGQYKEALEKNLEFHFAIYERSGKQFAVGILENVWLASGPVISLLYPKFSTRKSGVKHHQDVISGLKAGDADRVRQALVEDIQTGYEKIRSLMKADPDFWRE